MRKLIIAALLVASFGTQAKDPVFSPNQIDNLNYAYQYGEQFKKDGSTKDHTTRYDNKGMGYIFAAIAWHESSAGANLAPKDGHHAYGMFQNYLPTVRNRYAEKGIIISDREIIKNLSKRENSAAWAYEELNYWLEKHDGNTRKALAAYNAGRKWKNGLKYADAVLKKANYLKTKISIQEN